MGSSSLSESLNRPNEKKEKERAKQPKETVEGRGTTTKIKRKGKGTQTKKVGQKKQLNYRRLTHSGINCPPHCTSAALGLPDWPRIGRRSVEACGRKRPVGPTSLDETRPKRCMLYCISNYLTMLYSMHQ